MKPIIYCKFCNKPLNEVLGTHHICDNPKSKELWKGNIHSGNLLRNSKLIQ